MYGRHDLRLVGDRRVELGHLGQLGRNPVDHVGAPKAVLPAPVAAISSEA